MDFIDALRADDEELWKEETRRLSTDLREAARTLSAQEARFLVDAYYSVQHYRIQANNQDTALTKSGEPNRLMPWLKERYHQLERQVQHALDAYSQSHIAGVWARSNIGIGPVLAAGLLAHIDIAEAPTVGHIWSFAGLNPTAVWKEGERRPWNAKLKVVAWKCGVSFTKCSGREDCLYGGLYKQRKALEQARNEQKLFADQAADALKRKRIGKETEAYKWYSQGMLPPAHIQARSERWATKIFLAHLHEALYVATYGHLPPKPYVLDRLGHTTEIIPLNMELIPGWAELRRR
jgi:hypothetical protein